MGVNNNVKEDLVRRLMLEPNGQPLDLEPRRTIRFEKEEPR